MVEETTAASRSLSEEAARLATLVSQFRLTEAEAAKASPAHAAARAGEVGCGVRRPRAAARAAGSCRQWPTPGRLRGLQDYQAFMPPPFGG